jgi:amidase
VASAHDESKYWGYTAVFNATDLPGVVFPVTKVEETDTWDVDTKPVMGEKDVMYRRFWDEGGVEKYKDAPVNLQLVGRRLREERLLAVAEIVEGVIRGADVGKSGKTVKYGRREDIIQSRL